MEQHRQTDELKRRNGERLLTGTRRPGSVDQRDMRKRLRKVSDEQLACWIAILRQQFHVASLGSNSFSESAPRPEPVML